MKSKDYILRIWGFFLVLFIFKPVFSASSYTWNDGSTGEWVDTSNWDLANYPGNLSDDQAVINNGNVILGAGNTIDLSSSGLAIVGSVSGSSGNVTMTSAYLNIANLYLGWSGTGNFSMMSGNIVAGSGIRLGEQATGVGYMEHTGGNVSGPLSVGYRGDGRYEMTNGYFSSSSHIYIGYLDGSSGNMIINSGNVDIPSNYIFLGNHGTGNLIQYGGNVNLNRLQIANESDSYGVYNTYGGEVIATSVFVFGGQANATGKLNMIAGNVRTSNYLHLGSAGDGFVTLSGGNLQVGTLSLASGGSGNGTVLQSGGNMRSSVAYLGNLGKGIYEISGGNYLTTSTTHLGFASGSSGNMVMSGSANVYVTSSFYLGNSGHGDLTVNGGDIRLAYRTYAANSSGGSGNFLMTGGNYIADDYSYFGQTGDTEMLLSGGNMSMARTYVGFSGNADFAINGGYFSVAGGALYIGYNATGIGNVMINSGIVTTGGIEIGTSGNGRLEVGGGNLTATNINLISGNAAFRVIGPSANVVCTRYKNDNNNASFECVLSTNSGHFTAITCTSVIDMHGHLKVGLDGGMLMSSSNTFDIMLGEGDQGNSYASTPAMWDVNLITNAYGTQEALRVSLAAGNLLSSLDLNGTGNAVIASQSAGYVTLANIDTSSLPLGLAVLLDVQSGTVNTALQKMLEAGYQAEAFTKGDYDIRVIISPSDLSTGSGFFAWDFSDVSSGTAYSHLNNIRFEKPGHGTVFRFE